MGVWSDRAQLEKRLLLLLFLPSFAALPQRPATLRQKISAAEALAMASYSFSRSAVAGPSSHSAAACLRFPFASTSTSTSSFHLSPSPSTHPSSPRRSFSSSLPSPSAKKRHKVPFVPAATTHSTIIFKNKPNSYYPQNQFQPEANKTSDGDDRQSHKKAFLGATFIGSAASPESVPPKGNLQGQSRSFRAKSKPKLTSSLLAAVLAEILFAGRSNTGKSTLLNAIMSSEDLVKTSSKPVSFSRASFRLFSLPNASSPFFSSFFLLPGSHKDAQLLPSPRSNGSRRCTRLRRTRSPRMGRYLPV